MNKKRIIYLSLLLAGCAQLPSSNVEKVEEESLAEVETVSKVEMPIVVDEHKRLPPGRPVDVAPLVSNYLAGMLAEYESEVDSAAEYFSEAEGADPENYYLQEKSFTLQLAMGNVEEATRLARELVEMHDALPISYILLFVDEAVKGNYDEARYWIEKASTSSPDLLQFQLFRAYLDFAQGGDVDDVIASIREFKHHASLAPHKHYNVGRLYEISGRLDQAMQSYQIAYEQDTSSVFPVIRMGRIYIHRGEANMASELYADFIKNNPDSAMLDGEIRNLQKDKPIHLLEHDVRADLAEVLFGFSTLMNNKHEPTVGDQVLNMVNYLDPNYEFTHFYQGVLAEQMGDYGKALRHYRKVEETDIPYMTVQVRIGQVLMDQGKMDEAIKLMKEWRGKRPNLALVERVLAEMYYNAEKYPEAIKAYSDLIENTKGTNDQKAWSYFARGASYERVKKFEEATSDIEASIKLRPNNAMALNYLGYMWVERDENLEKAFVYISKALLLMPNDAAILDSMGWVLFKMQQYDKSKVFLEKAAEIMPEDSTINAHLGDVYDVLGNRAGAMLHWERALEIGFEDLDEMKALKQKLQKYKTADKH